MVQMRRLVPRVKARKRTIVKEKTLKPIRSGSKQLLDTQSSHPGVLAALKSGCVEAEYLV